MRLPLMALIVCFGIASLVQGGSWPQFRGPGSSGLPDTDGKLPAQVAPDKNVVWKVPLSPGHSSPVIVGDRLYLTVVRDKKLFTLALDPKNGKVLWEAEALHHGLEKIHEVGSHAQSTPATDGEYVISFFGSSGIYCYDVSGKEVWHRPMGPFKTIFGAASSPIIVCDKVILSLDHDKDSQLLCLDRKTGTTVWRVDRSEFPVSCASPVLWNNAGQKQIVVVGTLRVVGYDLDTGKEVWTVRGMARSSQMTPTIGPDGILYAIGWAGAADPGERVSLLPFDEMLTKHDKNKNGTLEKEEVPDGPIRQRFELIDRDKDGHVSREEWEGMRQIFDQAINRLVAIKPGGKGDITESHVLWEQKKHLPFVPSPLVYKGQLYLIKNGGIISAVDIKTGEIGKQERAGAAGNYYASPVGGDGKVYFFSQAGDAMVISAGAQWRVLSRARFGEEIFATPAIVDGRIYVRTTAYLYCFGE
jgi:outer membrane protein assembly factor BamB